jgi:hypothetical protein
MLASPLFLAFVVMATVAWLVAAVRFRLRPPDFDTGMAMGFQLYLTGGILAGIWIAYLTTMF